MKKYSQKNWKTLKIACLLGVLYGGYQIYHSEGRITATACESFGIVILMALIILFVVNKYYREKEDL